MFLRVVGSVLQPSEHILRCRAQNFVTRALIQRCIFWEATRCMTLGIPKIQGVWRIKYLEYATPPE